MLTEKILKDHVAFRKKFLLGKPFFSNKDILIETLLRAFVFSIATEVVANIQNAIRGKQVEFASVRFWAIVIGLSIITPIQLYCVNWWLRKKNDN